MKIKLNLPGRGILEFEREPMPGEQFDKIVSIVFAALYAVAQLIALRLVGNVVMIGLVIPVGWCITSLIEEFAMV